MSNNPEPERCMNCKFFRPSHAYPTMYARGVEMQSACARYPPTTYTTQASRPRDVYNRLNYTSDPISTSVHTGQPAVDRQGWCGEHCADAAMGQRVLLMLVDACVWMLRERGTYDQF